MNNTHQESRTGHNGFARFWAIVRYEMLWSIRKKKFIGAIVIAFIIATIVLLTPAITSQITGADIPPNPNFAITFGGSSIIFFLFAIGTSMNSISSEFENGTIVPLVTKPISRTTIIIGKLFGTFTLILISYIVLYAYTTIGSSFVYGPQNYLQYMPLILIGSIISTFIWVSLLFAVGSITKNTVITVIVTVGLFLAFTLALPLISIISGASPSLNYLPGSGALGYLDNSTISISTGTDNIGVNLVNFALNSTAKLSFFSIDYSATVTNETGLSSIQLLYTESISLVIFRAISIAVIYIASFLLIAWLALKRSEITD